MVMTSSVILFALIDLFFGVFLHALAADLGEGDGGACVEEAEEVVDFGDGADGRARVLEIHLLLLQFC